MHDIDTATISYVTILLLGLKGSLGHCIGMCGGFIVTYTASKIDLHHSKRQQSFFHLLYNMGRISSYTLMGAVFGAFGALWGSTPTLHGTMFAIAGVMMLLMGLSLSGKIRFLNSIEYNVSNKQWYKSLFNRLIASPSQSSFYFLGLLNGFFPCGLVYGALAWAVTAGSALQGAMVMLLFGLATMPVLFGFGFVSAYMKMIRFRQLMVTLASVVVIGYGLFTLYKSYHIFTYPKIITEKSQNVKMPSGHTCH